MLADNYEVLLTVWEELQEFPFDSETKARIVGTEAQMANFNFLFGVSLGALILTHSDNLSKTLQQKSMSAAEEGSTSTITRNIQSRSDTM